VLLSASLLESKVELLFRASCVPSGRKSVSIDIYVYSELRDSTSANGHVNYRMMAYDGDDAVVADSGPGCSIVWVPESRTAKDLRLYLTKPKRGQGYGHLMVRACLLFRSR
jgi:hypothetical protein